MDRPVVIAHRGASGYLPEHTLPAKALAHGMGADYLEQDVVATRDGALIVFHDLYLDDLTDVAVRYPGRARPDGRHYCLDFTLAELRTLRVTERRAHGTPEAHFPGRFPLDTGSFRIHTLEEELDLIQGLNLSTGHAAGIYTEIKAPPWHEAHGIDLGQRVLKVLGDFGYRTAADKAFIQCFDAATLQRLRVSDRTEVPLILLLDDPAANNREFLRQVAGFAQGIGPALRLVLPSARGEDRRPGTSLIELARESDLLVHPFTVRSDRLPPGFDTLNDLLALLVGELGVDGLFTDFPDQVLAWLQVHRPASSEARG